MTFGCTVYGECGEGDLMMMIRLGKSVIASLITVGFEPEFT